MARIYSKSETIPPETISLHLSDSDLDFAMAREVARSKARALCADAMLLSWCDNQLGTCYPTFSCGADDKPPWKVFADARGGNLTIDINGGTYVFVFLRFAG